MPEAAKTAKKTSTPRVAPELTTVVADIKLPEKSGRGSKSNYPFDTLEVGKAFGVKNKTMKEMASVISNANRKKTNQKPVTDANGNPVYNTKKVKQPDGTELEVPDTNSPKTEAVKHFYAVDGSNADVKAAIKGSPLEGSLVVVMRDR